MLIDSTYWRKFSRHTQATIVDFEKKDDEGVSYWTIVEYMNGKGDKLRSKNFQNSSTKPEIGKKVDIRYFQNNTDTIRIKGFDASLLFGPPFAAIPLFFFWELIANMGPFFSAMSLIGFAQGTIFFGCIFYSKFYKYYNKAIN